MRTWLLAFLLIPCVSIANETTSATEALKLRTSGKEKNFIFEKDPKAMISSITLVVRAGAIHDGKGKEGLHRFSYMALLRGTSQKTREQFVSELESLGATIEIDAGMNRTLVNLNVINENLEPAIKLLSEVLLTPRFSEEEFKGLKGEETAKLQAEKSNNRMLLRRAYRQALYAPTPLAYPPEGTIASIEAISLDDVKAAWKKSFVSGNLLWTAISNQSQSKIQKVLEKNFLQIPRGARFSLPEIKPRKFEGRQLFIVKRPGASTTETIIGHPGIVAADPLRDALETGMFIFGSDFTSRLSVVLRKENGWTYGAYSAYQMVDLPRSYGGYYSIYTFPQVEFTEKAVPKAIEMFEDYVKNGVNPKELEFAKNSMGNSYAFKFATANSRLMSRVYEEIDGAPFLSVPVYRKKIQSLTGESIKRAVQKTHQTKNLAIVVVGDPDKLKKLAELIPGVSKTYIIEDATAAIAF